MTLLAIECSSFRRSVAIARAGNVLAEASESSGRSTALFALMEQVLAAAALPRDAIDTIAIGLGPGSYTGIRAAIAVAQGWELARGLRLLGLPSSTACALHARRLGLRGRIAIVVDAQRGEFYVEEFEINPDDDLPLPFSPLRLASRLEVDRLARAGARLAGPDLASFGWPGPSVTPDAADLARLASDRTDFRPGDALLPIYLRAIGFVKAPPPRSVA